MKTIRSLLTMLIFILLLSLSACPLPNAPTTSTAPVNNRVFWIDTSDTRNPDTEAIDGTWIGAQAQLVYYNEHCAVYVRTIDVGKISTARMTAYADYFSQHSWPDVTGSVYTPTEFFNEPNNRINIFFFDMSVSYAGYFWSKDFYTDADMQGYGLRSNETNVFYMNTDSSADIGDVNFTQGTLTHEFQHMVQAHYFDFGPGSNEPALDAWANELCSVTIESQFANQYYDYVYSYTNGSTKADAAEGKTSLFDWGNSNATSGFTQYSIAALLGGSIFYHTPAVNRDNVIKSFLANSSGISGQTSAHALVKALQANNYQDVSVGTNDAVVVANWNLMMQDFMSNLIHPNDGFQAYLQSCTASSLPALSPATMAAATTSMSLRSSAFAIGKTSAGYLAVWNGSIVGNFNGTYTLPYGTATFTVGTILAKPSTPNFSLTARQNGSGWDRSMNPLLNYQNYQTSGLQSRTIGVTISGMGTSGWADGTADGFLYQHQYTSP